MVDYKCTTPSSTTLPFEEPTFESNEMYHLFNQSNQNPTESFFFSSNSFTLEDLFEPYQQQNQINNVHILHDVQGFGEGLSGGSGSVESGSGSVYRCQAEGCKADLTHSRNYHKRHKVCELHSKAPTVLIAGLTKRFCQQCSRFHLLSEFDKEKRSCRKRLIEHNRRRRMMGMKP